MEKMKKKIDLKKKNIRLDQPSLTCQAHNPGQ
jgi:hypothetical protein